MLIAERAPGPLPVGLDDGDGQVRPGVALSAGAAAPDGRAATRTVRLAAGKGRHAAPPTPAEGHAKRFTIFSAIGGGVFIMGLALQALLTSHWHVPPLASYLAQAVASVEASFLLNRWLTWRDRNTPLWTAFARFNAQKAITIALNFALYAGLLRLGMNYLVANVVLTIVFTVVNYAAGDRLVFSPRKARSVEAAAAEPHTVPLPAIKVSGPHVSVVIPVRDNEATIGPAVQSLLDQDYANLTEIILIGGPDDSTWDGLAGLADPRLTVVEILAPPGVRDANFKRDAGITMTQSELVALVDSDIVLPSDWMSKAVTAMQESGISCVAGGMKSLHDSFWGRYTDNTVIGAKTPRIAESYLVTRKNFGVSGRKPPITANALFTRALYDHCSIDPTWSHGSLEDYEWFWRVTRAGYSVLVSRDLFGWHHHRRGIRALAKEYRRSARGCAYFIRTHMDCPFSRRRLRQALILPLAALACTVVLAGAAMGGEISLVAALLAACMGLLAAQQILRMRRLEAVAYPVVGLALGVVYTANLVGHLLRVPKIAEARAPETGQLLVIDEAGASIASPATVEPAFDPVPQPDELSAAIRRGRRRLLPLVAICAVQAALSLSLVWSNTAFTDEADYIWTGRLIWAHWLHGKPLPNLSALSGSPLIFPPIGAVADAVGGLAGARILSLAFMITATVLLYLTAVRLIGHTGALFAAALWAFTEPVIRLAFATYDPLSVSLTALSAWLIMLAAERRHRGELVAAAAAVLALANATAFSGMVIDPVMIIFAYLVWRPRMGKSQAASAAGWLAGGLIVFLGLALTATHSWVGAFYTVFVRTVPDHQPAELVIKNIWGYSGLLIMVAVVGVVLALGNVRHGRTGLLVLAGLTVFLVPAAQLAEQTSWSLDKHLAYGIWFAAIPAGYACASLVSWRPGARGWAAITCGALALSYPAVTAWESAYGVYHGWPNATAFAAAMRSAVTGSRGYIEASGQQHVAEYYMPHDLDWARWVSTDMSMQPYPASIWPTYYAGQLAVGKYGVIALFYSAASDSAEHISSACLRAGHLRCVYAQLLPLTNLIAAASGTGDLTRALQVDAGYRLTAVGPYDTTTFAGGHIYGVYAVWQKRAGP